MRESIGAPMEFGSGDAPTLADGQARRPDRYLHTETAARARVQVAVRTCVYAA